MIPVHQDIHGGPPSAGRRPGNCFQACLASLLEAPLHYIPHFVELSYEGCWANGGWHSYRLARQWLRDEFDLDLAYLTADGLPAHCGFIASVPSRSGSWGHFIVVDGDLNPLHDPQPVNVTYKPYRSDEIDHLIGLVLPYTPDPDDEVRLMEWGRMPEVELGIAAAALLNQSAVPV